MSYLLRLISPRHLVPATYPWIGIWALVLASNIWIRWGYCETASWPIDPAAILWLGLESAHDGAFPFLGLLSSTGIHNLNGHVLESILLSFIPGGLLVLTFLLSFLQVLVLLLTTRLLEGLDRTGHLLVSACLLFNPFLIGISLNLWPSFNGLLLVHAILILRERLEPKNEPRYGTWFIFGLIIFFAPSHYLGYVVLTGAVLILLGWNFWRKSLILNRFAFVGLVVSCLAIIALSIVPYLMTVEHASLNKIYGDTEGIFQAPRILQHFWYLTFTSRNFFAYSDSHVIDSLTVHGWSGSFMWLLYLQLITFAAAAVSIIVLVWRTGWAAVGHALSCCPFLLRTTTFLILVHLLYLMMPSKVYLLHHQGAGFMATCQMIWIVAALQLWKDAGTHWLKAGRILLTLSVLCMIGLNIHIIHIIHDNLNYSGTHIVTNLDAPLRDHVHAVEYIAKQHETGTSLIVGYHFAVGNRQKLVHEHNTYLRTLPRSRITESLAQGRLHDCEFIMKHGLRNENPELLERYQAGNWLITYSQVDPQDLPTPWININKYQDFGRIRVYKR